MAEILNSQRTKRAVQLLDRLDNRRTNGKFDFTIMVGHQKIRAEQNILASGSEFFEKMLSGDTKQKRNSELELVDVDFESTKICIDYIYGRKVSFSPLKYESLMFVADIMRLQDVCDAIEMKMEKDLNSDNFSAFKNIGSKFGCSKLEKKCQQFAESNFHLVLIKKEFVEINKSFLKSLIEKKHEKVDEETKLQVIIKWVKRDESRKKDLLELMKCLNFSQISHDCGQNYMKNEPLINQDTECLQFLVQKMFEVLNKAKTSASCVVMKKKDIVIFDRNARRLKLFNPHGNDVKELTVTKPDVTSFSAVNLGEYIYVIGKNKSVQRLKYSEEGATWERMANTIFEHGASPPAAVLSGCIYVIGGHNSLRTDAMESFNPSSQIWKAMKRRPEEIQYAEILAVGECIFSFGGKVNNTLVNSVSKFHHKSETWTQLSPMHEARGYMSAADWKGSIYVAGGYDPTSTSSHLRSLERYESPADQWTRLTPMNIGRSWFRLHAIDGSLFAVGGMNSSSDSVERYDIEKKEWLPVENADIKNMKINESVTVQKT